MNVKSVEKLEKSQVAVTVEVTAEEFEAAVQKAYLKMRNKISVPGFRPGKAPRKMIEKLYGEGVFYSDAVDAALPEAYTQAIGSSGLDVVGYPEVEIVDDQIGKDGFTFKATVAVYPEVELGQYKGVSAVKEEVKVTADDVRERLNQMAERESRLVSVDRKVKKGDTAVIDFEGFDNGVAFEGGKGENHELEIGSGSFVPGFEDQIIGKNIGDEFDVNVTFPEDYGAKELAGKAAVFKVKLHEIKIKELPTVDDEFAKDVSEFDTLKELKADIKKKALERKQKAADEAVENALVQQIVDGIKGDIPEAMFENRLEQCVEDFAYRLQSQGLNLETYLKYTNSNIDDFKKSFRPQAEMQVKYRLALEKIVELENITPDEKDIEEQYKKMAEDYGVELEKVKAAIPASELSKDIAVGKAIDLVKENAVITEVEQKAEEEKKPAAKKTAAKKPAAKKTAAKKTEEKSAE